jgi:hypothetical protein
MLRQSLGAGFHADLRNSLSIPIGMVQDMALAGRS